MATQAPAKPAGGKAQAPTPMRPFRTGSQPYDLQEYDDGPRTMTTSAQDLPVWNISPAGYLAQLVLLCECVTAGNAATVAFKEDGPFSSYDSIIFEDTQTDQILGAFTGWDVAMLNKYGGYAFQDDPVASPVYSAVTGAGGTGGSFSFVLRIPVELVPRDTLGALPNKSTTSAFKARIRLAPSTNVYSTSPTTLGTVRTRISQIDYWEPNATDPASGRPIEQTPPALNTLQRWQKTDYAIATSMNRMKVDGVGFPWRNLIFVLRGSTAATARADGETDFPDPFTVLYQSNTLAYRLKKVWQDRIAKAYGYSGAVGAANGKDNGVYPFWFNQDFAHKPGWETRRGYLPTDAGTFVGLTGNTGATTAAHTFTVFINDVVPMPNPLALTGGV